MQNNSNDTSTPTWKFIAVAVVIAMLISGLVRVVMALTKGTSIVEAIGVAVTGLIFAFLVYIILKRIGSPK